MIRNKRTIYLEIEAFGQTFEYEFDEIEVINILKDMIEEDYYKGNLFEDYPEIFYADSEVPYGIEDYIEYYLYELAEEHEEYSSILNDKLVDRHIKEIAEYLDLI